MEIPTSQGNQRFDSPQFYIPFVLRVFSSIMETRRTENEDQLAGTLSQQSKPSMIKIFSQTYLDHTEDGLKVLYLAAGLRLPSNQHKGHLWVGLLYVDENLHTDYGSLRKLGEDMYFEKTSNQNPQLPKSLWCPYQVVMQSLDFNLGQQRGMHIHTDIHSISLISKNTEDTKGLTTTSVKLVS